MILTDGVCSSGTPADMSNNDLVSVIIPTHFRNGDLRTAIRSALQQTYDPAEVIVVDDSGERHAEPLVAEFPDVRYVPMEDNVGPQEARIEGLAVAEGGYVQFLDDDDSLFKDKLERQVPLLEDAGTGVVYSGLQWEDGPAVHPKTDVRGDVLEQALQFDTAPCMIGTMLIDRGVLEEVSMEKHVHGADDIGLKIELARVTEFEYVDDVLVTRGDSVDSLGTSWAAVEGRFTILETYADLYSTFPPEIRRRALAETYLVQGERYLDDRAWSPSAIVSFARASYHVPGIDAVYAGAFLLSLFGRVGYTITGSGYSRFVRGERRRGKST